MALFPGHTCIDSTIRVCGQRLAAIGLTVAICVLVNAPVEARQGPSPQEPAQIETLAVVNGQPISRQHLATQCVRRFGNDVLKGIIKKQLVMTECQRLGIVVTEKDINDEITAKASQFRMSAEHWMNLICSQRNLSPDRLKNDFIWHDVALRRLAADRIQVTPDELQRQIEIEFGSKVQIREIVCEDASTAQELHARVTGTDAKDFGTVAKDHSINPNSAAVRGLLPPVSRHITPNVELENVIFSMQPGEVSQPMKIAENQFVILKCERIFPGMELSEEQETAVHERLVEQISDSKLSAAAQELATRLQNDAEIINVHNDPQQSRELPGVAAIVNGQHITKRLLAEETIAQFGVPMLSTEINRQILLQELQRNNMQVTQEDIDAEIDQMAELLGYRNDDGSVNRQAWYEFATRGDVSKIEFYLEDEVWPSAALKKLVRGSVQVTDEDMQKGFEANFGPRVEVLMIVFNDNRQATKVWQMAMANPTMEYFGKLANQYSVDPASQANYGEVPPVQKHGGMPGLEMEAFNLQKGEISKVVQVHDQFVVLMCRGRTTPRVTEFDDVKEHLHRDIFDKKLAVAMRIRFDAMVAESQIDNFLVGTSQDGKSARAAMLESAEQQQLPFRKPDQ